MNVAAKAFLLATVHPSSAHNMKYRIEDIMNYLDSIPQPSPYHFYIREYASPIGDYHNEAVTIHPLVSDTVGVIIEEDPFNPTLYYTESEMLATFNRLEDKTVRIHKLLKKASADFNKYVGGEKEKS